MNLKGLLSALVIGAFLIGGCSKYNETKIEDENQNNERVYGEKGAPARQTLNKYESDPKSAERAAAVKEKLYPTK
jgi:hypothetical protein